MANIVSNDKVGENSFLQMSNGATSVFVGLLSVTASEIANSLEEIRLATCIASCDQSVRGVGCVGFDISDLPWSSDLAAFDKEKSFLMSAIQNAIDKAGWHKLDYEPDAERAIRNQERFLAMVDSFRVHHVGVFVPGGFILPNELWKKCKTHEVLLYRFGCVLCNDK